MHRQQKVDLEMDFEITFGPEWVEVKTSGTATLEGFRAFSEAVAADPRWPPGKKLLIDHSDLDLSKLSAEEIAELGRRTRHNHPLRDSPRSAFYVPGELQYAIGRMWQSYGHDPEDDHTQMFDIREQAEAWLRE